MIIFVFLLYDLHYLVKDMSEAHSGYCVSQSSLGQRSTVAHGKGFFLAQKFYIFAKLFLMATSRVGN